MTKKKITKKMLSRNLKKKNSALRFIVSFLTGSIKRKMRSLSKSISLYYYYKIRNNERLKLARRKYRLMISNRMLRIRRGLVKAIKTSSMITLTILFVVLINNIIDISSYIEMIRDIAVYGLLGFIIFFVSYFGWVLARNMVLMIYTSKMKQEQSREA